MTNSPIHRPGPSRPHQLPRRGLRGFAGRPVWRETRSAGELRRLRQSSLWSGRGVPLGDGRPVLVIPGFLAGPRTIDPMCQILERAEWDVHRADVGRNAGPAYHGIDQSQQDLEAALASSGHSKVTVIGHSRGGQFARILAVRNPTTVSQVITMGSPLMVKYPRYAVVKVPAHALDRMWRTKVFGAVDIEAESLVDADRFVEFPANIDFVSIYSKSDGIVDWRTSLDPAAALMEIDASHAGMPKSIAGVSAVAVALSRR